MTMSSSSSLGGRPERVVYLSDSISADLRLEIDELRNREMKRDQEQRLNSLAQHCDDVWTLKAARIDGTDIGVQNVQYFEFCHEEEVVFRGYGDSVIQALAKLASQLLRNESGRPDPDEKAS